MTKQKKCAICGVYKGLNQFNKSSVSPDGHHSYCRPCLREYHRNWYLENKDRVLKRRKSYIEENSDIIRNISKKYRKEHPDRVNAYRKLNYAIEKGEIRRPSRCEECGTECEPHGHHPDYSKPFYVVWVCVSCHKAIHNGEIALKYG